LSLNIQYQVYQNKNQDNPSWPHNFVHNDYITAGIDVISPKDLWKTEAEYPMMTENWRNDFEKAGMGHGLAFIGRGWVKRAGCVVLLAGYEYMKMQNAKCKMQNVN
jgi:hypothetical protein